MLDDVTLGIRLDQPLSRQLARFASSSRRSKSDVTRDALRLYLARVLPDEDLKRELALIAAATCADDLAHLDAVHDDLMRDEPDYDWGLRRL